MAVGSTKIIKSLVVTKDGTLTPSAIEISPAGSNNTKTTVVSSQTTDVTVTLPNVTDTLTGRITTDTLQNKTLLDSNNHFANTVDPTKRLTFDLSKIPTTKNRVFKWPDVGGDIVAEVVTDVGDQLLMDKSLLGSATFIVSDDLVAALGFDIQSGGGGSTFTFPNTQTTNYVFPSVAGSQDIVLRTLAQTLTNKTLTTPVIASILTNGGASTLTLPTTTDTLVGRNTTDTLTNKTLTAPIIGTIVNTGTLTLPTSTDTLVGRATADILTNKDLDGGVAANNHRITVPSNTKANLDALTRKAGTIVYGTDTQVFYYDNGTTLIGPLVNPMTTTGDIIYGGVAGAATRLAGVSGVLQSTGAVAPTWTQSPSLVTPSVSNIQFPASQVTSANPNNLDDYEEGTFTPTAFGTGTAGAGTYTLQQGVYTKIGDRVFFTINISWTAHTGTGNLLLGGLPFTSNATSSTYNPFVVHQESLTLNASYYTNCFYNSAGSTTISFVQYPVGGGGATGIPMDTAVSFLFISGHYRV